ncbi:MAG TPA: BamA/TamA family outer membrane protein [Oscillatoriaceae cyanobacterium M33_DOE_052]|uniref:Bacterial surface antigen (D15) domain-containing protein n=1 Tax=Planktothricoides sp. SpSt-374 TaxID=2282167 RepID=A0A7C3ZKN7_9CYAN|nr:BamA/TamA family outer membrane protein [Oscillatoriaceae cyanobacterium M33_DOE_052]
MSARPDGFNPLLTLAAHVGAASATLMFAAPSWGQAAGLLPTTSAGFQEPHLADMTTVAPEDWAQTWRSAGVKVAPATGVNLPLSPPNQWQQLAQDSEFDTDEPPKFSVTPLPGLGSRKGAHLGLDFQLANLGENDLILGWGLEGGVRTLAANISLTDPWAKGDPLDGGWSARVFNTRWPEDNFLEGEREVNLIHDHKPWVHRLGGGFQVFQPVTASGLVIAGGVNYQRVSIRNAAATDATFTRDQLGNRMTISDNGQDDLLTLNLLAFQDRRDDPDWPLRGYRFSLGTEQSLPVGRSALVFNRLSASFSQFVPIASSQTLVFHIGAGTFIGDAPPYEAFGIGGTNSVRGFKQADVGVGRSFVQTSLEYRFPITEDIGLPFLSRVGGTVFADYGTDLGSGDTVPGQPGEVRDKPGNGAGVGIGLRALSVFGPVRVEFALSDEGDARVHLNLGERF